MPTNDEVLGMISDGGKLTAIADLTGWPKGQVVALARENGYGLNVSSDRFQPAPQARPVPQGVVRQPPPAPAPAPVVDEPLRPSVRDLLAEGRASTVVKVNRAAARAQKAIDELDQLLEKTRAEEMARRAAAAERAKLQAEVDELARQLDEKRALLRAPRAKSRPTAAAAEPKAGAKRAPVGVDYRALDEWCQANGHPWRKFGHGRPTNELIEAFHASQAGAA